MLSKLHRIIINEVNYKEETTGRKKIKNENLSYKGKGD